MSSVSECRLDELTGTMRCERAMLLYVPAPRQLRTGTAKAILAVSINEPLCSGSCSKCIQAVCMAPEGSCCSNVPPRLQSVLPHVQPLKRPKTHNHSYRYEQ